MPIKNLWRSLLLTILFYTSSVSTVYLPTVAESNLPSKRPSPPPRVPPNKVKPGGGLSSSNRSCNRPNDSLIAFVPVNNPVLTARDHPSFLFYIPDAPQDISRAEFLLFTADEKKRVYQTFITFNSTDSTPIIIKIDLPTSPQFALEDDKMYHWYFKIHCRNVRENQKILDVDGWVQKIATTTKIESEVETASPEVWYDAIARVAENLIANPQDSKARERWSKLLQYIDREDLTDMIIPIKTFSRRKTD